MIYDLELPSDAEAMILPLGMTIARENADFEGSLGDARQIVKSMSKSEQENVVIWTPGHVFGADELLAERKGHEHDVIG